MAKRKMQKNRVLASTLKKRLFVTQCGRSAGWFVGATRKQAIDAAIDGAPIYEVLTTKYIGKKHSTVNL